MPNIKMVFTVWLHFAAILILAFIGNLYIYNISFNISNLIQWDSMHYLSISQIGYRFQLCEFPETAFFPLFPYLWRLFSSTALSSFVLNLFLFSISIHTFKKAFNIPNNICLLYIALPSCFFFVMPYTESCQFLGITLLLTGIHKSHWKTIFIGSLLATLSRPTFTILIPTMVIVIFLNVLEKKDFKNQIQTLFIPFITAVAIGILIVNLIQFHDTNVWWGMIKSQECWEHGLHPFTLPIKSWGGTTNSLYDGMILLTTLLICIFLIFYFSKNYLLHSDNKFILSPTSVFSLTFMAGVGLTILLFQKDSHSINRYFFCSPCFLLLMQDINLKKPKKMFLIILTLLLLGYFIGAFLHITQVLNYMIMLLLLGAFIYAIIHSEKYKILYITYIVLTLTQIYLLMLFMQGKWIA